VAGLGQSALRECAGADIDEDASAFGGPQANGTADWSPVITFSGTLRSPMRIVAMRTDAGPALRQQRSGMPKSSSSSSDQSSPFGS